MMRAIRSASDTSAKDSRLAGHQSQVARQFRRLCNRCAGSVRRGVARALCLVLILSLLSTSTPAAPQTIIGAAGQWQLSLAFWFRASGWAATLRGALQGRSDRPAHKPQEKQNDRDARVARLQISPGDVTLRIGQRVIFAAIAYDLDGAPVGGVRYKWRARDVARHRRVKVSPSGEFEARMAGTYQVTVEGAKQQAQVTVTVLEGDERQPGPGRPLPPKVINVSSRDLPPAAAASTRKGHGQQRAAQAARAPRFLKASLAHAPATKAAAALTSPAAVMLDDASWNSNNYWSADEPGNQPGNPPGSTADDGAGSGNFQLSAPVLGLEGRGIDLALALTYNSRVWNKAGSELTYDIDRDWPAPGWSLGFGKILGITVDRGSLLIDADGTRHSYSGTVVYGPNQNYTDFTAHTTDGTFIDYTHHTGIGGALTSAQAKFPNGTVIQYDVQGTSAMYPSRITDASGNFITITYRNNTGPQIETITDTLGRVITFHYDANNLLTAITAPGFNGGTPRTLVRLHYQQLNLAAYSNYGFSSAVTTRVRNPAPWVIDAIYYPATQTGYWFGDGDSYSSYGMIAKAIEQRAMSFAASSLNEQGTVTQGSMTQQSLYNYPLQQNYTLTDETTYTTLTETWTRDGVNTDQAVTNYEVHQNASPRTVTITLPNGTKSIQYSHNAPGQFNDGLVYQDETRDPSNNLLQSSAVTWEMGAYDAPRPTRTEATDHQINKKTATAFQYGTLYNQVTGTTHYDYTDPGAQPTVVLRTTATTYENSAAYTGRHIFNLVQQVDVFGPDGTRASRTAYQYDGQPLVDAPGVTQHDAAYNPYAPTSEECGWEQDTSDPDYNNWGCWQWNPQCDGYVPWIYVCHSSNPYNLATAYRGNVTQVKTYADAVNLTEATAVVETRNYDITGNLVKAATACCQQTSVSYTLATQYAYPTAQTRGHESNAAQQLTTSVTYDFNSGLALSATDANGRTSTTTYETTTLRPQTAYLPTDAYTSYAYDDAALTVSETTYTAGGAAMASQSVKRLNGRGQVRREEALGAGGVWDVVETRYDALGRVSQQSRPYRDGAEQPQWSSTAYDALGRVSSLQAPDGSLSQLFYNEAARPDAATAGTPPGQTTRAVDAWGRERWARTDADGRLVEVVEPNPDGTGTVAAGGLLTTYSYDSLGRLTAIVQGQQQRTFRYDSLGRLTHQKLAEASATLTDAGQYLTPGGTWSDVFAYDTRSNLLWRTDARGVKTLFSYTIDQQGQQDPLNRLQSVEYDTTGFGDRDHSIAAAPSVSYSYMASGDVTRLSTVTAAGVSSESYSYDAEGRLSRQRLTVNGRPAMDTDYAYDTLDRVTDVLYPAQQLGVIGAPRKLVHHDYDVASRLQELKVDNLSYASSITYNAASQTTSLLVGGSSAQPKSERYEYDPVTGLLARQRVVRGTAGQTLLDISYDYLRPNTSSGRTGQLTRLVNNLNHNKDRSYTYDAVGRLKQATGGPTTAPLWTQSYTYDRYGNRTSVTATGHTASLQATAAPQASVPNTQLAWNGNGALAAEALFGTEGRALSDAPHSLRLPPAATTTSRGAHAAASMSATDSEATQAGVQAKAAPGTGAMLAVQGGTPVFTDDPLIAGVTPIKAVHLTELRTAVNQVRARAGLSAATWTDAAPQGLPIKAIHILELRQKLDEARAALGLTNAPYTDPQLSAGSTIRAVHIQELRDRVKSATTTSLPVPRDGVATLAYDQATNRITTAGYEYDAAGNQTRTLTTSTSKQRYKYDAAGRLAQVLADDNQTVLASYTYGDTNQRLLADESGYRTYFVWSGSQVLAEYGEVNNSGVVQWSKSSVYLGARLLATLQPNGSGGEVIQYHHPDRLGTRLVSNAADAGYYEQVTLPYGTALEAESTGASSRRFTSYERSASSGLDYAINRQYDSWQGRFTQVDPLGIEAVSLDDPQTLNMFAYCGNDPINHTDPDGLFFGKLFKWISKAVKIIIAVAAAVAIFVGILATAGALAPVAGVAFGLKLFAAAAIGLAGAFGPPWLQKVISIGSLAFGLLSGAGVLGFAEGGGGLSWGRVATLFGILQGVGAVADHLQRRQRRRRNPEKPISVQDFYGLPPLLVNQFGRRVAATYTCTTRGYVRNLDTGNEEGPFDLAVSVSSNNDRNAARIAAPLLRDQLNDIAARRRRETGQRYKAEHINKAHIKCER